MGVGVLGVFSRYSNKFSFQKYYMENRSPMPQVVTWSMFMKYRALQDRIPPRSLSEESEVVIFHHPSPLRGVMHPCDVASPVWACEPELFASPAPISVAVVSPLCDSVSHVSATPASRVPVTPVSVSELNASPPSKRVKHDCEAYVARPHV